MSNFIEKNHQLPVELQRVADFICSCQQPDGAIRWYKNGKLDPWDHTEAAMALTICGRTQAFINAYSWLQQTQANDGSWSANYFLAGTQDAGDDPTKIETNFVAYPATGIWHGYLVTQDIHFARKFFPMVKAAINFVLRYQNSEGDIQWAISSQQSLAKDALVTACSSILRSLQCAIQLAALLDIPVPQWHHAYQRLANALLNKPWRFDRTWESKERFSMDWFYPILAGIYSGREARLRLKKRWYSFVEESLGCRCVSDEPWVTVAESCELVMATIAAGRREDALEMFQWLSQWQDSDGGYWTGYSFRDKQIWPKEKTSWTAAAIVLATDALYELTPASKLFTRQSPFLTSA